MPGGVSRQEESVCGGPAGGPPWFLWPRSLPGGPGVPGALAEGGGCAGPATGQLWPSGCPSGLGGCWPWRRKTAQAPAPVWRENQGTSSPSHFMPRVHPTVKASDPAWQLVVPRGPGAGACSAGPTGSGARGEGAGRCCRPGSPPPGPPGSPRWAGRWAGGSHRTPARPLRGEHPPQRRAAAPHRGLGPRGGAGQGDRPKCPLVPSGSQ